jgi:transposase
MGRDDRANRYTPETRERAVRMVLENEGSYRDRSSAIRAIAPKIGCSRESLRRWVAQSEIDVRRRDGLSSDERAHIRELEREVRELRQANEILKKASAYIAQAELDRPLKR